MAVPTVAAVAASHAVELEKARAEITRLNNDFRKLGRVVRQVANDVLDDEIDRADLRDTLLDALEAL